MKPLSDNLIVFPHYDSDRVGSIIIPESAANPQSQQGDVLGVGPKQEAIEVGDHILYEPYQATPLDYEGREVLVIPNYSVVCWLAPDGEAFPLPDAIMVAPDWDDYEGKMIRPQETFVDNPRVSGTCVRRGKDINEIIPGQKVFFHTGAGHEVGIQTTVYYFIKEEDILAICSG